MTAGPNAGIRSVLFYLIGLVISYVCAYLITAVLIPDKDVEAA